MKFNKKSLIPEIMTNLSIFSLAKKKKICYVMFSFTIKNK